MGGIVEVEASGVGKSHDTTETNEAELKSHRSTRSTNHLRPASLLIYEAALLVLGATVAVLAGRQPGRCGLLWKATPLLPPPAAAGSTPVGPRISNQTHSLFATPTGVVVWRCSVETYNRR